MASIQKPIVLHFLAGRLDSNALVSGRFNFKSGIREPRYTASVAAASSSSSLISSSDGRIIKNEWRTDCGASSCKNSLTALQTPDRDSKIQWRFFGEKPFRSVVIKKFSSKCASNRFGKQKSNSPFVPMAYSNEEKSRDRGLGYQDGWDPSLEIQVPEEQRPVNELAALKDDFLYAWAQLSTFNFFLRAGALWFAFFIFLGGPIASATYDPLKDPVPFFLAGSAGSLFPVSIIVLRIYLGWSYVGDRLLSAVIPYEESGWYDGQLWVKPPEILARDRLIGSYQVKPIIVRLKRTLIAAASLLTASALSLVLFFPDDITNDFVVVQRKPAESTLSQQQKNAFWLKELTNPPPEIIDDDDLATAAAQAARGRPVYCQDRYYRALAGGQYCRWSDLKL